MPVGGRTDWHAISLRITGKRPMTTSAENAHLAEIDPVQLLVMANRIDGATREMTNTLVWTTRSATLAARDFSTSVSTADHELFSAPEGAPVHVYGSGLLCQAMAELHPDFQEGDAFLHNDPYLGNTHAADHTILVPVFFEGEHIFTTCVKAHQADIGDSLPTTYMPNAVDVYAEGALIFPCVRIQKDYEDVGDIIRMCQKRIRVPEIWYGDYLAMLAAARVGQSRLEEFCQKFGLETVRTFVREWLDYCERLADAAIRRLPPGRVEARTTVDPFPLLPHGLPLKAEIDVDAQAGSVTVDLRDNADCTPTGLNLSRATAMNGGISGILSILNSLPHTRPQVPNNAGAFRRIHVLLRENCVVGVPVHPVSCSMATSGISDRIQGMIYAAFGRLQDGIGLAEPCWGQGPVVGVVSGFNRRRNEPYMLQLFSGSAGGPAGPSTDGWLTFLSPGTAGLLYIDESEVIEQKYPFAIFEMRVWTDSEGAGRQRGAPGCITVFGPLDDPQEVHYSIDGMINAPQGVQGGGPARGPAVNLIEPDGGARPLPNIVGEQRLHVGQRIVSLSAGGGGYGDPHTRDPQAVLQDVVEGYVSTDRARAVYRVAVRGDAQRRETLSVDAPGTARLRDRTEAPDRRPVTL